jgi:hypothetical protein
MNKMNKIINALFDNTQSDLFIESCSNGDMYTVSILLEFVDPSMNGNRAINQACIKGHFDIVDVLLSVNQSIQLEFVEIIDFLIRSNHEALNVVNRFLQDPTCHPKQMSEIFKEACLNNSIEIIDRLLQDPRLVEITEIYTFLPSEIPCVDWAITRIHINIDVFIVLLQKYQHSEQTIITNLLTHLLQLGNEQKIIYLLHMFPHIDLTDNISYIIRAACHNGLVYVVDKLYQDYADRFDPTVCEHYAFRISCEIGCIANVRTLLQDPRTDPSAYNNEAIKTARNKGFYDIVELIRQDKRYKP